MFHLKGYNKVNFYIAAPQEGPANSVWIAIGVGVTLAILVLVVICTVVYILYKRRNCQAKPKVRRQASQHDAPPTYNEVMATNI